MLIKRRLYKKRFPKWLRSLIKRRRPVEVASCVFESGMNAIFLFLFEMRRIIRDVCKCIETRKTQILNLQVSFYFDGFYWSRYTEYCSTTKKSWYAKFSLTVIFEKFEKIREILVMSEVDTQPSIQQVSSTSKPSLTIYKHLCFISSTPLLYYLRKKCKCWW